MDDQKLPEPQDAENRPWKPGSPIVLVGASIRWAAQSARRGGLTVWGMDRFGDRDTIEACDQFRLHETAHDVTDSLSTWPGASDLPIFQVGGLFGQHASNGLALDDLHVLARRAGLLVPDTYLVDSVDLPKITPSGHWLWKQANSTGGLGVRRWQGTQPCSPSNDLVQRWVAGRPYGFVFLADRHQVRLLGCCRNIFVRQSDRPFVYAGSRGPYANVIRSLSGLMQLAESISQFSGIRGLFNIDGIVDRQGDVHILEVNARPSGSCEVIERAMISSGCTEESASLMRMHIDAMMNGSPTLGLPTTPYDKQTVTLKRIVYANRSGSFSSEYLRRIAVPEIGFADIPNQVVSVRQGEPLMTILSQQTNPTIIKRMVRTIQGLCRP